MNFGKVRFVRIALLLAIPLLFAVGCAKRDAQKAITQADQAKTEAQQAQAPGYVPNMFNDANNLLNLANQHFEAGDYQQAIDTSNRAQSSFASAANAVPAVKQRVDQQTAEIEEALATAATNVQSARDGGALQPEEINPVADVVDGLQAEYDTAVNREVDEEALNAFLARVNDAIAQTESLATAHLRPQAVAAKDEITQLLEEARQLKADIHAPDQFNAVQGQLAQLDNAERDGNWQSMIDLATQIKEPLNQIISLAQEKAAGDIIQEIAAEVNQAKSLSVQGVDEYAANLTQAEADLGDAQAALQSQQFSEAIDAANGARAAIENAYLSLGNIAGTMIETAKTNLQAALDQQAETYAPNVVAQLRESIAGAEEQLQAQNFASAYATAQKAAQASEGAIEAARRGKAQISLNKVEQPFSVLHSQGGSRYAPEAYQNALAAVQKLRNLMQAGEYESVNAGEVEAVQVVQASLAELAKSAAAKVETANTALEKAQDADAPKVVAMLYANAVNQRDSAEKELAAQKFLAAIQKSESAVQSAQEAENRSYQLQAEQNLREADRDIAKAETAGQKTLSPLAYRNAVQAKEHTQQLLANHEFKAAFHRSLETKEASDRALNNLIYTAQEQSDDALSAKALTYADTTIKDSLALLTQAEEAQKSGQYAVANDKAQQAIELAAKAEHLTYEQRSAQLLAELATVKEELDYNLAPKYTPALYRRVLDHLTEAKVKQIDAAYEESFMHADKARESRDQIYSTMANDLNATLSNLQETANWMGENALDPAGRNFKITMMDSLAELERQIALQDWHSAYLASDQAVAVAEKARAGFESSNRKALAMKLNEALAPYKKQNALIVVPEKAETYQTTLAALTNAKADVDYDEAKKQFDAALESVDALPADIITMANQRVDEVMQVMQQAQEAGSRRYYADWTRELNSDLQWVRNSIQGEDFAGISSRIEKLEKESAELLTATEIASQEAEYLNALDINLSQMNIIIEDFGSIVDYSPKLIAAAKLTEYKLDDSVRDLYRSMQGTINARSLRINAELLEERVKEMQYPETMAKVHKKAILAFETFRKAGEHFEMFGENESYNLAYREKALNNAYVYLKKTMDLNTDLQFVVNSHRKLDDVEKLKWKIDRMEQKFGDFYYNYDPHFKRMDLIPEAFR